MGKKGSWFSAIKRVFVSNSKEKLQHDGSEKLKSAKEKKKWGLGRIRHGENNNSSFIPIHREPSSIEKILRDAERDLQIMPSKKYSDMSSEQQLPRTTVHQPVSSTSEHRRPPTPSPPPPMPSAGIVNHHHHKEAILRSPRFTPRNHQTSAIKIQAAFRGYMARVRFRALKGLVRLQGAMRGQSVKRQTMNAMKHMQLLVRVQSQIQSRRIQMLDSQAAMQQRQQNLNKIDKELESSLGKWATTQPSETGQEEEWDDSLLTKEEIEARLQRKVDAVIKRERALAYAYSHQLLKATPNSAKATLLDIRSGGLLPWWWNWVERELPGYPSEIHAAMHKRADLSHLTPPRPLPAEPTNHLRSPISSNSKQQQPRLDFNDIMETTVLTPRSSKSAITTNTKYAPPILSNRTATNSSTPVMKHVKPRTGAAAAAEFSSSFYAPLRDDESLTSCPPFSVPNYMVPTVSAKAKVRAHSNPKERDMVGSSSDHQKRRLSFPLTQSIGSLRWNKGSLFSSNKDSSSPRMMLGKNNINLQSIGNVSIDSTVSLPVGSVGKKPFKRFV